MIDENLNGWLIYLMHRILPSFLWELLNTIFLILGIHADYPTSIMGQDRIDFFVAHLGMIRLLTCVTCSTPVDLPLENYITTKMALQDGPFMDASFTGNQ